MEPVNLVIIGNRRFIQIYFKKHGWFTADKLGALSLVKALISVLFNKSYHEGPISGSYVKGRHFTMGFQHPTRSDTYRRRHHLRLWRTSYKIMGRRVWVGTLSYERSAGLSADYYPTHHISPTLSWEEDFLASTLGINRAQHLTLAKARKGQLNNGDSYDYDGKALVVNLSGYEL